MNILVLGGCGFIGSHLVDQLLNAGYKVRVFDRAPELHRPPRRDVDYRFGVFSDVATLSEALEGIDVVYHLISTTVPSTSNLNPIDDVRNNLICTLQLLNLMVQMRIPKIVYFSSGGTAYGTPQTSPIPEDHPLNPICSYGVVKVAIENYLHMFNRLHDLKHIILRLSNPYGERQGHYGVQGVIGTFMGKLVKNEPIEIWGDGEVIRDYVYVGDIAKLCASVASRDIVGIFNVGSGKGLSVNKLVESLASVSGQAIKPIYKEARNYDAPTVVLDTERAHRILGWRPETTLSDGLHRTWQWVRSANRAEKLLR